MILAYFKKDSQEEDKIIKIFQQYDFLYKEVGDNHLECEMEQLKESKEIATKGNTMEDFLFLDEMDEKEIQDLLKLFKQEGIQIGRVCVATENNKKWTLRQLMEEVDEEYRYFAIRDEIYSILKCPDKERLEKDENYLRLFSTIYAMVEENACSLDDLKKALNILKKI